MRRGQGRHFIYSSLKSFTCTSTDPKVRNRKEHHTSNNRSNSCHYHVPDAVQNAFETVWSILSTTLRRPIIVPILQMMELRLAKRFAKVPQLGIRGDSASPLYNKSGNRSS